MTGCWLPRSGDEPGSPQREHDGAFVRRRALRDPLTEVPLAATARPHVHRRPRAKLLATLRDLAGVIARLARALRATLPRTGRFASAPARTVPQGFSRGTPPMLLDRFRLCASTRAVPEDHRGPPSASPRPRRLRRESVGAVQRQRQ